MDIWCCIQGRQKSKLRVENLNQDTDDLKKMYFKDCDLNIYQSLYTAYIGNKEIKPETKIETFISEINSENPLNFKIESNNFLENLKF
jgi:hypothetical protein